MIGTGTVSRMSNYPPVQNKTWTPTESIVLQERGAVTPNVLLLFFYSHHHDTRDSQLPKVALALWVHLRALGTLESLGKGSKLTEGTNDTEL